MRILGRIGDGAYCGKGKNMADRDNRESIPPDAHPSVSSGRQTSLARGLAWAVPLGACGFCVPYLILGAVILLQAAFTDMLPIDRDWEWRRLPGNGIAAAVICAMIFAFAAIANFAPRGRIGFIRALLVMATFALVDILAVAVAVVLFRLGPQSYTSDPYAWLRCTVFLTLLCVGGIAFIRWQIRNDEAKS
jgi:hypothetical protein